MEFENNIKSKLLMRGFTEKQLLNNRGLIGAVIDETILLHTKNLIIPVVSRSKTLETKLINKRDKLKKDRLQIQNLINNNNSMSYDYIYDKVRMIPFLNSQIDLINTLLND